MDRTAQPNEFLPDRAKFRRSLQRWFKRRARDLPWRRTRNPYAILVSEFMLQQTQVATVIPYYKRWIERFPDFPPLAAADESDVLHAWQGLGYYARARNLHAAARLVTKNFGGELPADLTRIAQLPGVGRYTAGAIASFAFDLPEPIVDANIARVLARLTNWQNPIDSSSGRAHLWRAATALLPTTGARQHNSALMDLGAMICRPRQPRCTECPVRTFCRAPHPAMLPIKKKRLVTAHLLEPHAFIRRRNRVLLEQSRERWHGMWILPRLPAAPRRQPLLRLDFPFTHHRITLAVFALPGPRLPNDHQQWFALRALDRLPVPSPHRRALAQLLPTEKRDRSARPLQ
jgi:A/G-specific adenine glycosylase